MLCLQLLFFFVVNLIFSLSPEQVRAQLLISGGSKPRGDSIRGYQSSVGKNPFSFTIQQSVPKDKGGLFVHDLNDDGLLDFIITSGSHVGAYNHSGQKLWVSPIGIHTSDQYPGLHHPGAIAGDMDGDGRQEVAYIASTGELRILEGMSGKEKKVYSFPGAQALVIANLRGLGDRDAILQYNQTKLKAIQLDMGATLWETDQYLSGEHSPLRVADLDGDGLDEVVGVNILDHHGSLMHAVSVDGEHSVDSVVIADIRPGFSLEIALAEQTICPVLNQCSASANELIVATPVRGQVVYKNSNRDNACTKPPINEPQEVDCDKIAVGNFDPTRVGLEVLCRSACGRAPWVVDANGSTIAEWVVDHTRPPGWTEGGLEEVVGIDWDGDDQHEILAKERHVEGDAAIIDPLTGVFKKLFKGAARRVYGVDFSGDAREEVIILNANGRVDVYSNPEPSLRFSIASPWTKQHYRRQKQNWNYYSP